MSPSSVWRSRYLNVVLLSHGSGLQLGFYDSMNHQVWILQRLSLVLTQDSGLLRRLTNRWK